MADSRRPQAMGGGGRGAPASGGAGRGGGGGGRGGGGPPPGIGPPPGVGPPPGIGGPPPPPAAPSLASAYPVNTLMELRLSDASGGGAVIRGLVYCTDETSNSIVLRRSLPHTTLTSEITVINAATVLEGRAVDVSTLDDEEKARELAGVADLEELKRPLPNVSRRAVEERERRAIRLAEESFGHVNQRASPEGQRVFDKLLKACNEVTWRGESILVLKEIRVDPPYAADDCRLVGTGGGGGGLDDHSLQRVKRIVASASSSSGK